MKNDLGLSKGLLNSVSSLLNTSSKQKQEEAKADHERLAAHVKPGSMRPLSMEEAKVASYAAKAPERRVSDTITQLYTQSVADHNAKAQAEAAVIKTAYGKMGGVQPVMVSEEVVIDVYFDEIDDKYITNPLNNNIKRLKEKNFGLQIRKDIYNFFGIKTSGLSLEGFSPFVYHGITIDIHLT